jgi:hypothetical protein
MGEVPSGSHYPVTKIFRDITNLDVLVSSVSKGSIQRGWNDNTHYLIWIKSRLFYNSKMLVYNLSLGDLAQLLGLSTAP